MLNVTKRTCCGCTACEAVCHHGAISFAADELGFSYPMVNEDLCVGCGRCEEVCPFNKASVSCIANRPMAFAAQHQDIQEVIKSRSGAVFAALSDSVLAQGGVIYGAGFDAQFNVVHGRAESSCERDAFRGSKYAQSSTRGIFSKVLADLKLGRKVLFSGTPCQVAALSRIVPKAFRSNLSLVDIVCHGVASPAVWRDWLGYVLRLEQKEIRGVNFRDKNIYGWDGLHRESFTLADGRVRTIPATYYQPFLIRESCSECPFASMKRVSDITLGDFWGHEKAVPDFPRADKGISLVLVNTMVGAELFEACKSSLVWEKVPLSACSQPNLNAPSSEDKRRKSFVIDYSQKGFDYVRKHYWPVSVRDWLKYYIKRAINRQ